MTLKRELKILLKRNYKKMFVLVLFQNYMTQKHHIYQKERLLKVGVLLRFLGLFLGEYAHWDRFFLGTKIKARGEKNLKIEELEKELKNGNLSSLYLLYGEEKFLMENSLKKIKNLFGECLKGINYITIDDTNIRRDNFRFRNSKLWI